MNQCKYLSLQILVMIQYLSTEEDTRY